MAHEIEHIVEVDNGSMACLTCLVKDTETQSLTLAHFAVMQVKDLDSHLKADTHQG